MQEIMEIVKTADKSLNTKEFVIYVMQEGRKRQVDKLATQFLKFLRVKADNTPLKNRQKYLDAAKHVKKIIGAVQGYNETKEIHRKVIYSKILKEYRLL